MICCSGLPGPTGGSWSGSPTSTSGVVGLWVQAMGLGGRQPEGRIGVLASSIYIRPCMCGSNVALEWQLLEGTGIPSVRAWGLSLPSCTALTPLTHLSALSSLPASGTSSMLVSSTSTQPAGSVRPEKYLKPHALSWDMLVDRSLPVE